MLTFSSFNKANACVISRKHFGVQTSSKKNVHFDEAVITKDVIRGYLKGEIQLKEIPDIVSDAYVELSEITKQQEEREKLLSKLLTRACRSEHRTGDKVSFPEKKVIPIPEMEVAFDGMDEIIGGPDAAFETDTSIELVIYKKGSPQIKQNSGTRTVKDEIPLYLLIQYGKTMVPPGETRELIASYYYMKKTTDKSTSNYMNDFFDGGGNVVSLQETYTAPAEGDETPRPKSELDMIFEKKFEEYAVGYECSGDDCKNCQFDNLCNYKKAPEVQEQKEIKARKKVTPSAAQQAIIDAREGYFKVNAGAGAGKTECVSERFIALVKAEMKADEEENETSEESAE